MLRQLANATLRHFSPTDIWTQADDVEFLRPRVIDATAYTFETTPARTKPVVGRRGDWRVTYFSSEHTHEQVHLAFHIAALNRFADRQART